VLRIDGSCVEFVVENGVIFTPVWPATARWDATALEVRFIDVDARDVAVGVGRPVVLGGREGATELLASPALDCPDHKTFVVGQIMP
jgi:hypothetical protein